MAYRASGGPYYKSTSLDGSSTTNLIAAIVTELTTQLNWTTVSGSGTDYTLQSPAGHPFGFQVRMRIATSNGLVAFRITNVAGTRALEYSISEPLRGYNLNVGGGKTYTLIGSPWQCAIFTPGSTPNREWIMWTMPWVPSFVAPKVSNCFMIWTNEWIDSSNSSGGVSLRSGNSRQNQNQGYVWNDTVVNKMNWDVTADHLPNLFLTNRSFMNGIRAGRWKDGRVHISDAYLAISHSYQDYDSRIRAQFWDSWWYHEPLAYDEIVVVDSLNFQNMTGPSAGNDSEARGQLLWRIP